METILYLLLSLSYEMLHKVDSVEAPRSPRRKKIRCASTPIPTQTTPTYSMSSYNTSSKGGQQSHTGTYCTLVVMRNQAPMFHVNVLTLLSLNFSSQIAVNSLSETDTTANFSRSKPYHSDGDDHHK